MCTDPITMDDKTFACRRCDECIATRRHNWVARAMAEKSLHSHAVCITLTYSDDTDHGRDAASMFCYADVSAWLKRIRAAAARMAKSHRWNVVPNVRFVCAGEQGDRNGRCHWHVILYSNFDVSRLGDFTLRGRPVTSRRDLLTEGKRKRRLHWSLWDYGFVTVQEADQGSFNYVLSYCLKDQFTYEKSQGTMREAKSENFATGLFRMSKRPAIGEAWLVQEMERLDRLGAVLPSLSLRVPDFHGYWVPSGTMREKLLWHLAALNRRHVFRFGCDAPQWSSLLASCKDNESDLEILNGEINKEEPDPKAEALKLERRIQSQRDHRADEINRIKGRCGKVIPCEGCLASLTRFQFEALGIEERSGPTGRVEYYSRCTGQKVTDGNNPDTGRLNPYCLKAGSYEAGRAFPKR